MGENSAIEWTDHTFNPWMGCTRVSPACANCYAAVSTPARTLGLAWGPGQERRRTSGATWAQPIAWNRRAAAAGRRDKVFCASLADVFDNEVEHVWRRDLFALIEATPSLVWLLLTKRIGNARRMADLWGGLPGNIWLGATIADRDELLRDAPKLLGVPAARRFWSVEPMLGDLGEVPAHLWPDWVICGGESGSGARPMHPNWARNLRDQCAVAGVPFLFKQWGEWAPGECATNTVNQRSVRTADWFDGAWVYETMHGNVELHVDDEPTLFWAGKKAAGRTLDGVTHDGVPA